MSDEELALAEGLTAEEELLQWAAEPEPVSLRLRTRVLAAVRERVRRKQARREMQWAAAGLLTWMLMTHGRAAAASAERARITAEAPFQGKERLPAGADAERGLRRNTEGLLAGINAGKRDVEMRHLDDQVLYERHLGARLTTRHLLEEGHAEDFLKWAFQRGTENS